MVLEKTLENPMETQQGDPASPSKRRSVLNVHWKDLKLKVQYFGDLMQKTDSSEKILMLEKIEGGGRMG